jgi:cyclophilin family peptidyl-prolyl cis-trans isomerase
LNGQYTVFGRVISGMDIVEKTVAEDRIVRMTVK